MPRDKGLIIKITLDNTKPPIWRRVAIPYGLLLPDLHTVIQEAMGWHDIHLHCFVADGKEFGPVEPNDPFSKHVEDEEQMKVVSLFHRNGAKIKYHYDFGDDWRHTIEFEGSAPEPVSIPTVLAGRRACPPEDCGGPFMFAHLLKVMKGEIPASETDKERLLIIGRFPPEAFDVAEANKALRRLRFAR